MHLLALLTTITVIAVCCMATPRVEYVFQLNLLKDVMERDIAWSPVLNHKVVKVKSPPHVNYIPNYLVSSEDKEVHTYAVLAKVLQTLSHIGSYVTYAVETFNIALTCFSLKNVALHLYLINELIVRKSTMDTIRKQLADFMPTLIIIMQKMSATKARLKHYSAVYWELERLMTLDANVFEYESKVILDRFNAIQKDIRLYCMYSNPQQYFFAMGIKIHEYLLCLKNKDKIPMYKLYKMAQSHVSHIMRSFEGFRFNHIPVNVSTLTEVFKLHKLKNNN